MRVAVLLEQLLAPVPGGTGRWSGELAAALARTAAPGDVPTGWVGAHRDVSAARVAGVSGPRRLPLPPAVLARAWARGRGPAPRGADLVHAPTPLLPPPGRVPLVVTVHDTVPWTHPATMTPHGVRWHRTMITRAAHEAAAVTVPTAAVAADLLRVLPALDPARVHVLGAGVPPDLVRAAGSPDVAATRRRLGLPTRYVVSLATAEPRKGLDVLVAALARLGPDRPVLVCVGASGWGDVDPAALAHAAGLPDAALRVLGRIPDVELAAVLTGARLLAAPSRAEGFGLPVLEAMALGVPVVATDVPAHLEVAAGAARWVPVDDVAALADALGALVDDDPARAQLAERGRLVAAGHTWDAVAQRAWSLYRDVLG